MIFDILFLPVLFFIAAITCYEDFKYGKVRNKWILLGIFWGVIVVVFFVAWYFIASPVTRFYYLNVLNFSPDSPMPVFTVNPSYLGTVLWNFLVAFVVAFLMWRFGAWAAGDAKLFAVFAFLLPLKYYWKTYFSYFPSFVLLSNIFLLIFLYLLFRSCFFSFKSLPFLISGLRKNFKKQGIWEKVSEKFSWSKLKKRLRSIPCFIWIFLILGLFQNTIEDYLLMFCLYRYLYLVLLFFLINFGLMFFKSQ